MTARGTGDVTAEGQYVSFFSDQLVDKEMSAAAVPVEQLAKRKKVRKVREKAMATDKERVEAIREAIAKGRYQINPKRVARALIEFEPELFETKKRP